MSPNDEYKYLIFGTKKGFIKRTLVSEFENIRNSGKICISLRGNDELIGVKKSTGNDYIMMGSTSGRMVVFNEEEIRVMGRTASGVRGINLGDSDCVGLEVASLENNILIVTENGYGKKTLVSEFRTTKRGSKGVRALNITDKNGNMVAHKLVTDDKDLLIITEEGMIIRLPIEQVNQLGRVTQGVKLINLKEGQVVSTISIVEKQKEEAEDEEIKNNEENITEASEIYDEIKESE